MSESVTTLELQPEGTGTTIAIRVSQKLRGMARFGAFMVKRATARQLDEALDGLERIVT
jgi:hypothetical protein